MRTTELPVLRTGCLAYYDSMAGPIPCRVLSITSTNPQDTRPSSDHLVRAVVIKTTKPYKKGEEFNAWSLSVFPKTALIKRKYNSLIGPYLVQPDLENE